MKNILRTIILSAILVNIAFGNKVNILYTANINATYKDCNCGSNPLGGINRIKTYIEEFRSENNNTLVIDGGNYFNSYQFLELNMYVLESLSLLNYDVITPGLHIFLEDKNLFNQYSKKYYNQIISSNSNLKLLNFKDFTVDGIKIRFFGYISPKMFKYIPMSEWLSLKDQINSLKYLNNGQNIIIYNGYLEGAKKFLKEFNQFDALFLSSDQQNGTWQMGKTTIIGGGHDAESIALVKITVVDNNSEFDVKYIEMDNSIRSDQSIIQLFESSNKEKKEM